MCAMKISRHYKSGLPSSPLRELVLKHLPEHCWSSVFTILEIRTHFKIQFLLKITLMLL